MTEVNETEITLRLAFRAGLRDLCTQLDKATREAGASETKAAQIVAEECLRMAAYFVAHGSPWSNEKFAAECLSILQWHREHPPEELKPRPPDATLN